jgi:hypothetical protein
MQGQWSVKDNAGCELFTVEVQPGRVRVTMARNSPVGAWSR